MPTSTSIRLQIESALAHRIPSALTPAPKLIRPVAETGIESLDELLHGGVPVGALSEVVGPECSGRTGMALSFVAHLTQTSKVCAWIDASNAFDPVSAAAAGVDLARLLWVRCGVTGERARIGRARPFVLPEKYLAPRPAKQGLHGGGFGSHPRNEVKGMPDAVGDLLQGQLFAPRCAEPQRRVPEQKQVFKPASRMTVSSSTRSALARQPWAGIEQALTAAYRVLGDGGFAAVVLDLSGVPPAFVSRIESSDWFRFRAAAERTQSSILLLAQYACAKSAAELSVQLQAAETLDDESTIFTGIQPHAEVKRQRFAESPSNVVSIRKPPQSARWQSRTTWAGAR